VKTLIIPVVAILVTACSGMRVELEHTSHPFAGPPFGPRSEEDSLDTLNVIKSFKTGRVSVDLGLGRKLGDGGFYGPRTTATARISVSLDPAP
jgi:hypothetical protein